MSDAQTQKGKCLPLYSQNVGTNMGWYSASATNFSYSDFEINGRYCDSGLAFPILNTGKPTTLNYTGNCTATDRIFYNNTNITYPFPCDPTQQS